MGKISLCLAMVLATVCLTAQKSLSAKDAEFTRDAYRCGLFKIRLGGLTASKAKSDSVKVLARQMIVDHTRTNEQLKTIAAAKNITLSDSLSTEDQKHYNDLSTMSGTDFDKTYVQLMITDHKKAIERFKDEDDAGSDIDVRSWAAMALPVLKHHLMILQDLNVDLDKLPGGGKSGSDKPGTVK